MGLNAESKNCGKECEDKMKEIIITTQEQLDALKEVKKDELVFIKAELKLNSILEVYGYLKIEFKLNCSFIGRYIRAWENSSVVAWENSSVVAWENSSVVAWGNSSVVARGNSSVVAWGNSCIRLFSALSKIIAYGFSVVFCQAEFKSQVSVKSKFSHIQVFKSLGWFENNGVEKKEEVILFKKVSKDFKTQENTPNETRWTIGSTVTHPNWQPKIGECGEGKFHACSRPYFCDEFRNEKGDQYIAIEIKLKDLYEWKNPSYPHKIGFRKGKVLYRCDKFGKELKLTKLSVLPYKNKGSGNQACASCAGTGIKFVA